MVRVIRNKLPTGLLCCGPLQVTFISGLRIDNCDECLLL